MANPELYGLNSFLKYLSHIFIWLHDQHLHFKENTLFGKPNST